MSTGLDRWCKMRCQTRDTVLETIPEAGALHSQGSDHRGPKIQKNSERNVPAKAQRDTGDHPLPPHWSACSRGSTNHDTIAGRCVRIN